MYELYINGILLPVAPGKLDIKVKNQNTTVTLMDGGEINLLKRAALTDIEFNALLPNQEYLFSVYTDGYTPASYYLDALSEIKSPADGEPKPVPFTVSRFDTAGEYLFGTSLLVSLEDFSIVESKEDGTDVTVKIKLKQYRTYGTKTYTIKKEMAAWLKNAALSIMNAASSEVKEGSTVKIVEGAKYYDGRPVPEWARLNSYVVSEVSVGGFPGCVRLDRTGLNELISVKYLQVLDGAVLIK